MKQDLSLFILTFFCLLLLNSCSSNNLDDIQSESVNTNPNLVTFQDVKFTFDNVCQACHSNPPQNGAPMPLVTYLNVKDAVINRGLLDRISRANGDDGLMPNGGPRLPQSIIDMMFQWNSDGLLEN